MKQKEKLSRRFILLLGSTYMLVLLLSGIWMVFFDRYNVISQMKMKKQIEQLEKDKAHYQDQIEKIDYEYTRLHQNPEELERYAREKYFMKKKNEDIFVVEK